MNCFEAHDITSNSVSKSNKVIKFKGFYMCCKIHELYKSVDKTGFWYEYVHIITYIMLQYKLSNILAKYFNSSEFKIIFKAFL